MSDQRRPYQLPEAACAPDALVQALRHDYQRFAESGPPDPLEQYVLDRYQLDVTAEYAGFELKNPWGKASGQLSMTARQVAEDVAAGLGFIVLKTVIAQDQTGVQTMEAWAIKETRMVAEPIEGESGERGWTISWKGRGWWLSFDEYLQLIRDAQDIAQTTDTLIVPSCKYHLPTPDEDFWKIEEYEYTTPRLLEAWQTTSDSQSPMPLEKDFSPTLAGSDLATEQANILQWLRTVPRLIRSATTASTHSEETNGIDRANDSVERSGPPESQIRVGLKIFNALFEDEFQNEMLRTIHQPGSGRPDFFIYGNRLFDPNREFDGHRGIAFGGPDLSDRNLRTMDVFRRSMQQGDVDGPPLPWSATGNIVTGKMALEYALQGASSFQLHTFFQLPSDQYSMKCGSKIQKALHELYFHPETGFIVWMHHLASTLDLPNEPIRFCDVVGQNP